MCNWKEHYHPTPSITQHPTCVQLEGTLSSHPIHYAASNMCASARNVIIPPTPPHPIHYVASNMCATGRNIIIPPHPLRSIQHVCKCKERYHPTHPTPPHPTPPHPLRSIQHVCNWKEHYHPTPSITQHPTCVQVQGTLSSHPPHPTPSIT